MLLWTGMTGGDGEKETITFLGGKKMKKLIVMMAVLVIFTGFASAACRSMDATGDCKVDLEDFAVMDQYLAQ
ncbi:MAG: hypothetical protein DRP62_02430 [Planctomycetota bacterium]|nr:MAG: hypothetical protein DRP62_02430 [Planctomycetota bacterium]